MLYCPPILGWASWHGTKVLLMLLTLHVWLINHKGQCISDEDW